MSTPALHKKQIR